jgi:creatinine amidohydrolase/Fe(II)-dependent formamide hydrolase-like protein
MARDLHRLIEMSSPEVAHLAEATRRDGKLLVAIMPVGSIEQHGPLLPLGTDSLLAEGVAEAIARIWSERADTTSLGLLLPCWHFTNAETALGFAGTASVAQDALRPALMSFLESILRLDVAAIVLLNGHGPNDPLLNELAFRLNQAAIRDGADCAPLLVASIPAAMGAVYQHFGEPHGRHADWLEVALLLRLMGERLLDGRAAAFERHAKSRTPTSFPLVGIPIERRGQDGVLGKGWLAGRDPTQLSKEAWEAFFPPFVSRLDANLTEARTYLWPSRWAHPR